MLPAAPHEEIKELCALSTTGELTAEEWRRLREHLAQCASCRAVKQQYERVVAAAIPALGDDGDAEASEDAPSGNWSLDGAEAALMKALQDEPLPMSDRPGSVGKTALPWRNVARYAVAASLLLGIGIASYFVGVRRGRVLSSTAIRPAAPATTQPLPTSSKIPVREVSATKAPEAAQAEDAIHARLRSAQAEIAVLQTTQAELQASLSQRDANLAQIQQERADVAKQLADARSDAQSLQARLNLVGYSTAQDAQQVAALQTRINELNASLDDKNSEVAREQDLLARDRDIRNLISARNLYIAEIYDVAKTGDTQKPFGRIFYTKGKSLVFYGYDLDQQHGVKQTSTFQAWGRQGSDPKHAVNLGLLYEDDAAQKRWILKCDDPKSIASIDAVFVTVEPKGGSSRPSGKPLLFTYLRIDPNHP